MQSREGWGEAKKKNPEEYAWSEYWNNFKKNEREYIFSQSNKLTTCKVRNGNKVAKYLMMFNLRKIIHPFQSKKYLRT